jgi:hypothetical protein
LGLPDAVGKTQARQEKGISKMKKGLHISGRETLLQKEDPMQLTRHKFQHF